MRRVKIALMLMAVCVCMTGCFGRGNDVKQEDKGTALTERDQDIMLDLDPVEEEVYDTFVSTQGYQLEYNPNRFVHRVSEGYDYFIGTERAEGQGDGVQEAGTPEGEQSAAEGTAESASEREEYPNTFFAVSMIAEENMEAVKSSVFREGVSSGDCILAKGTLSGKYAYQTGNADTEIVRRRTFVVSLNDGSGNGMLIETQFPYVENSIWEKRFDHMLDTIVILQTESASEEIEG